MAKSRNFLSILVPSATIFISSFCIMVLELVAARLIARYLGSSLYTWTAVIGVVLAGISIGNYLGGRIADRFNAKKALAVLFALSSVACVLTIILNNAVSEWLLLWRFTWPLRVFTHVSLVFLLPSTLLGTISPVVAKMALGQGLPTGRTVGDIYAWGAAGSIAGTFATGYFLILLCCIYGLQFL
jgi:MFS family permease